jgi:hypothetical protein
MPAERLNSTAFDALQPLRFGWLLSFVGFSVAAVAG